MEVLEITRDNILHEKFIQQTFELAQKGFGNVSPNPLVGAVIVKDENILSTGYHAKYGTAHAEADALNKILDINEVKGATLYCNLEPCCHTNKQTPPCAQRIIKAGIKKVIISNRDPNPNVSGKGIQLLKDAGIEVIEGILKEEGETLNKVFFKNMKEGLPFIHLKVAQTLDGKMASISNDSKWISDEEARRNVHHLRFEYDAVAIGRNTQIHDNPKLTARLEKTISPYRIVFGNINKMNREGHLFNDEFKDKTIVLTTIDPLETNEKINWINIKKIELPDVFKLLYKKFKITSILIEGGPTLLTSILDQNLYDQMTVYINPILLGNGHSIYKNENNLLIQDAIMFGKTSWSVLNNQAVLEVENVHRPS